MARTLEIMAKTLRENTDKRNWQAVPIEFARRNYHWNSLTSQQLKILYILIFHSKAEMDKDKIFTIPLSEINKNAKIRNYTEERIKPILQQLTNTEVTYEAHDGWGFSHILSYAHCHRNSPHSNQLMISFAFGHHLREIALKSVFWAMLDQNAVMAFTSQYSILLYERLCTFFHMKYKKIHSFSLEEIRTICGISNNKYTRSSDLVKRVIIPSVQEIEDLTPFMLITPHFKKTRNQFTHVDFHLENRKHREKITKDHLGNPIGTIKI